MTEEIKTSEGNPPEESSQPKWGNPPETPMKEEKKTPEGDLAEESSRPKWGRILAWVGLLTLLGLTGLGLVRAQRGPVSPGEKAPDFILTTYDGDQVDTQELRGKVVVLNFWASWCKPCEQEAADLEAAWRYYEPAEDVVFLGVAYTDTPTESQKYLDKFEITYPNGDDLRTLISDAYRIRGVPETYIISPDGMITHAQIGPFMSLSQIQSVIEAARTPSP
jgi:cytochrome c biogenesis protein CcmG/thiol:disulfide interchange protein DsbE